MSTVSLGNGVLNSRRDSRAPEGLDMHAIWRAQHGEGRVSLDRQTETQLGPKCNYHDRPVHNNWPRWVEIHLQRMLATHAGGMYHHYWHRTPVSRRLPSYSTAPGHTQPVLLSLSGVANCLHVHYTWYKRIHFLLKFDSYKNWRLLEKSHVALIPFYSLR